ncbi:MAG TPA: hypothetical protein EYN66_16090 [Myxococcales bacterium]|nr:hypothetical protein [Myxococcales bacterium]
MSEPTNNADIVAAIEGLTAEIGKLREAVCQLGEKTAPQSGLAPSVATSVSEIAVLSNALPQPDSEISYQEIYGLIAATFMAATDPDNEAGFESFLKLIHSDRTEAPQSIPSLREFTWRSLRKNHATYLSEAEENTSFEVVCREPETIDSNTKMAKLFLKSGARSPVPVIFKRDPNREYAWRITDCSL